jgi:hypothetical protein
VRCALLAILLAALTASGALAVTAEPYPIYLVLFGVLAAGLSVMTLGVATPGLRATHGPRTGAAPADPAA